MRLASPRQSKLSQAESQWHDVLRLLLLLQVVFGHMAAIALPSIQQLTADLAMNWPIIGFRLIWRFGSQAAFLFVFLSGFMVGGPLLACTREGHVPLAQTYFARRLRRILPISAGAVLLTALLDAVSRLSPGAEIWYHHGYAYDMVAAFSWMNFIGNALFLQPVFVDAFGSNGPLWTLGYIVQYYIFGWIFCKFYARSRLLGLIVLVLIVVLTAIISAEWSILFVSWLVGGIARQGHLSKRLSVPCLFLAFVLFVLSNLADTITSAALSILVGLMLTLALRHLPEMPRFGGTEWLRRLSNDSYVIYAVHHPVLMSIFSVMFAGSVGPNSRFLLFVATSIMAIMVGTILLRAFVNLLPLESLTVGNRNGDPK